MRTIAGGEITIAALCEQFKPRLKMIYAASLPYAGSPENPVMHRVVPLYQGNGVFMAQADTINFVRETDGNNFNPTGVKVSKYNMISGHEIVRDLPLRMITPQINQGFQDLYDGTIMEGNEGWFYDVVHDSATSLRVYVTIMGLEFI